MTAEPVKGSLARKVKLPPIPDMLDYPATRQSTVSIPSRIARDSRIKYTHLRVLIELASAGADNGWVMMPTLKHFALTLGIYHTAISRAISDLTAAGYIEIKPAGRYRYARLVLSAFVLDWE